MPTTSVSDRLSDAIYFASIVGLSVLLARPVYLAYGDSQQRAAEVVSSGLASAIDSLTPGASFVASVQHFPGTRPAVTLFQNSVLVSFGSASATSPVRWALEPTRLSPGQEYNFTLEGGTVEVAQAGTG